MIISKLIISNFRSYYGKKEFVFSPNLNLILGSNGDGKTTFFEAINWVLTPDYAPKSESDKLPEDRSLVSAKMFNELKVGAPGRVLVLMELKNNTGQTRYVERSFNVFKTADGSMKIEGRVHKAYQMVGAIRKDLLSVKDLFEKENVFPAVIKKYHIFKGEDKLNIFNDKTTLQTLIDMFAEVKDLEPYKDFMAYATATANKALTGSKDKVSKQNAKLLSLQKDLNVLTRQLENAEKELVSAQKIYNESKEQIDAIEADAEIIRTIAGYESEIESYEKEIARLNAKMNEDYTIKLLDEQWILMGFAPILKEFNMKLDSLYSSKNNIENEYRQKQEDEYNQGRIVRAKSELEKVAWNQSDIDKMKYMLRANRCIYCGNDAPDGSVPYDFIKQRINDVIDILTPKTEEKRPEIKKYFNGRNIEYLRELGLGLTHSKDLHTILDDINSAKSENNEIKKLVKGKESKINSLQKKISELYANSSTGENLKEYVKNFAIFNRWHEQKQSSAITIERLLTRTIPDLKEQIKSKRSGLLKDNIVSGNDSLFMVNEFFRVFQMAIENIESSTYEEFLERLAKEANVFLTQLNVDDFTGIIKIYMNMYNELKIELQDRNGQIITNPNTSLLTTMHISILFAISELTKENRDEEYPLIFDAPTSSFEEGKDKTFYECLNSQVNKQCIVVTKSYLLKNDLGEYVTDEKGLSKLQCKKYRIKKLTGFDKLDLTTIDTQVEEIK